MYAGDLAILSKTEEGLKESLQRLRKYAKAMENENKCKED